MNSDLNIPIEKDVANAALLLCLDMTLPTSVNILVKHLCIVSGARRLPAHQQQTFQKKVRKIVKTVCH